VAARETAPPIGERPVGPGIKGGLYRPLSEVDQQRIHHAVLDILERIGLSDAIPSCVDIVTTGGGFLNDAGRLCFSRALVEDTLARACKGFMLHGQEAANDLDISGQRVHFGTGGAAVSIIDFTTGRYRLSTLEDLYDVFRLIDTLEHIHFALRPLIARDIADSHPLEINTAYAGMTGTTKPFGLAFSQPETVEAVVAMLDMAAGGEGKFRQKPFCHTSNCFVVPPLRFAADACRCLEVQVRLGMPIILLSAGQAGATAPAALAGAITQAVAECLAGLVYVNLISPGHPVLFGTWPLVSDLRTGAMSGGSGEQAVLMAASAQMANFYGLPSSVAAGMTDSKVPDAQSGFEKGYTTALAGHAGATMIHESAGMTASLLGVSLAGFVIDNDMLGAVLRSIRGIEVTDETLSVETMAEVVAGPNHYLGHAQTLARMEKDYVYPHLSDRSTPDQWESAGAMDMRTRARGRVVEVLSSHYPDHIGGKLDARIRQAFDIRLPEETMKPGNGRW
jgi:trimethylamine--corrinoid protein Co-methyltransferase